MYNSVASAFFFWGVGMAAGYAIVWQLPFGKCLGQASPGATSPLLGRSPDCSCGPLHGGSQRFTLWPQTKRRSGGGVCESCRGGRWGHPQGDASPGHWHLVGSGQGCRSTPSSAQGGPHDTEWPVPACQLCPVERPWSEGKWLLLDPS